MKPRIVLGCILVSLGLLASGAGAQVITEFSAGITGRPVRITAGPDGNLWFTERPVCFYPCFGSGWIGRITPDGVVTEFKAGISDAQFGITAGPDGNVWFTEPHGNRIGRITPAA